MGTKYTDQSAVNYNAVPPVDDGTVSEANKGKWSTIKTKLTDPIKTQADAISDALVTHFDNGPRALTSDTTLGASDYGKIIQVSGSGVDLTLTDAATLGAGWYCRIVNTDSSNSVTIGRATGGDTINGSAANYTLGQLSTIDVFVIAAANGFRVATYSTADNTITLTNKTLTSPTITGPTITGTIAGNPTITAPVINSATGIGYPLFKIKANDESVNSSTTLQDDNDLTFPIGASETWIVYIDARVGSLLSSTGFRASFTIPSGATIEGGGTLVGDTVGKAYANRITASGANMDYTATDFSSVANAMLHMRVTVVNGATPGNVTFQWAQQTSSGSNVTVLNKSTMMYVRTS